MKSQTWRVRAWREADPPASYYYRGSDAKEQAERRADELKAQRGVRKVDVTQIFRSREEGGAPTTGNTHNTAVTRPAVFFSGNPEVSR